jgi:hydroxyethylthiazole kinase-like uncharacterized protein yjeF
MTELLTAAQMRAIEQAAIASGRVTGLELMERAGRGVVEAIFQEWPDLAKTSHRAVVLCGPGNNGGDGFVVARLLREWGWEVEVFLYGDPEKLPPDARVNCDRWLEIGTIRPFLPDALTAGPPVALCLDALFGIGLTRPIAPPVVQVVTALAKARLHGARVVAVDICSGLCADSGRVLGDAGEDLPAALPPDLTVTFHRMKVGHLLGGAGGAGRLVVTDIGLGSTAPGPGMPPACQLAGPVGPLRKEGGHKYRYGHALVISGPSGRGGAARLAARGALRIGAGLVTVGCPPDAIPENAARLDAVMLRAVADAGALTEVLQDKRITALCLGPGLGIGAREAGLLAVALESRGSPRLVLDADALTILSRHPHLFAALHDGCILTPHAGEFARLFPDIAEKLATPATTGPAYSKVDATREAAARAGCTVLYKGPDTVIADPSGRCAINSAHYDRSAPWLATAGSGDVLAGFITGLLARDFGPFDAACTGAWLHVECARSFGPGLIAEDLPEELPRVFRTLGLWHRP